MKNIVLLSIILFAVVIFSCSLEHTNPLDPQMNPDVYEPPRVDSLWVYYNNFLLTWVKPFYTRQYPDTTIFADGYYIWGAREWNTKFDLLSVNYGANDTTLNVENYHIEDNYLVFKVSSYKVYYPESPFKPDTLEGYSSRAVTFQN